MHEQLKVITLLSANDSNVSREALEFGECIEENFFTQHVDMCTRNDAILDLIITDESEEEEESAMI